MSDVPEHDTEQRVQARGGAAYGTVGGDIHVDGRRPAPFALVSRPVTDADGAARADLRRGLRHGSRLVALWLHDHDPARVRQEVTALVADAAAGGWTVLDAVRSDDPAEDPDVGPLHLGEAAGVLVVVDGIHRWPGAVVRRLLSDGVLHHPDRPARLVLVARTLDGLPELRGAVANLQVPVLVFGPGGQAPGVTP
ncbi:hypothetical protein [Actinoplanes sp. NPDC049265]|uniref:hypothetical protein n=1 Tax=Actinoplanes sp. NPDC049265 TaxID=3363902 RepID=UPI003710AE1F